MYDARLSQNSLTLSKSGLFCKFLLLTQVDYGDYGSTSLHDSVHVEIVLYMEEIDKETRQSNSSC